MFTSWDKCTEILVNVSLSAVSLRDHDIQGACDTWQALLKNTLGIQNTDGNLLDVVSASSYLAVPPLRRTTNWDITAADVVLLLFTYFSVFSVVSNSIKRFT